MRWLAYWALVAMIVALLATLFLATDERAKEFMPTIARPYLPFLAFCMLGGATSIAAYENEKRRTILFCAGVFGAAMALWWIQEFSDPYQPPVYVYLFIVSMTMTTVCYGVMYALRDFLGIPCEKSLK